MKITNSSQKGVSGVVVALLLIVVVVAVVFLFPGIFRGGLGGGSIGVVGPGSAGVVIKSFTVDASVVEKDTPISFTLIMENIGEREAAKVKAELIGLSNEWKKDTATVPFTFGTFNGESGDKLAGADQSTKTPGDVASEDIILTNKVAKDIDTTYTASARVSYAYDTSVEGQVRIVNRDYAKTQGATSTQSSVTAKATNGPLAVSVRTRTATVVTEQTTSIKIIFDVSNRGGGRTYKGSDITFANVDFLSVDTAGSGTTIKCPANEIKLIDGTKTITCDLTIPSGVTTFQDLPFKLKLSYNYFVTASTQLTYLKTIGGTTTSDNTQSGLCAECSTATRLPKGNSDCPQSAAPGKSYACVVGTSGGSNVCCTGY